jgi:hypothetical protein
LCCVLACLPNWFFLEIRQENIETLRLDELEMLSIYARRSMLVRSLLGEIVLGIQDEYQWIQGWSMQIPKRYTKRCQLTIPSA